MMLDLRTDLLSQIISNYPNILDDFKLFRALLMDYYPNNKLMRNVLISSFEEQIPHDISLLKQCSSIEKKRLVKRLMDGYGYGTPLASQVVELWVSVYGVKETETESNLSLFSNNHLTEKTNVEAKPIDSIDNTGFFNQLTSEEKSIIVTLLYSDNQPVSTTQKQICAIPDYKKKIKRINEISANVYGGPVIDNNYEWPFLHDSFKNVLRQQYYEYRKS